MRPVEIERQVRPMPPVSPAVARWELGLRLRQRRKQLGVDVKTITKHLDFSRNYWSAVENDHKLLSEEKLYLLLALLEFDDDEQKELLALREAAKQRGWWSDYSALFSDPLLRFYGLEYGAYAIRTFENLIIPGLLQTQDYARALISSDLANVRQVEVDQLVEVRMRRQERLFDDDPLHLTAIISEACLLQEMGGPDTRRAQLRHIVSVAEDHPKTVEVRVIPFATSAGGILGASTFHLIEFTNPRLPTLGWQEAITAYDVVYDTNEVRALSVTHTQALHHTLDADQSLRMIRRHAEQ